MNPRLNRTIVNTMYRQLWAGRIDDDEPESINAALELLSRCQTATGDARQSIRNRRIWHDWGCSGIQDHIHPF